ncbi:MAG: hypothetical protein MJ252_29790 [archaeon]|nr:hypothetical protein [archaeon]
MESLLETVQKFIILSRFPLKKTHALRSDCLCFICSYNAKKKEKDSLSANEEHSEDSQKTFPQSLSSIVNVKYFKLFYLFILN